MIPVHMETKADSVTAQLWYMIRKDLLCEMRAKRAWPAMLLLGLVVAIVFSLQIAFLSQQKAQVCGIVLWVTIFFAGLLGIDRSCASEQADDCWEGLLSYPVSPAVVYWSKLLVNALALGVLELLVIPAYAAVTGVEILRPVWAIALVAIAATFGLSAVGTLLSALANGIGQSGQLLALLVLPLAIPVILAAAEATRLIALGRIDDEWWRWLQLLIGFAVIFIAAGTVLFEFVIED